jgi:hypothetical protein
MVADAEIRASLAGVLQEIVHQLAAPPAVG